MGTQSARSWSWFRASGFWVAFLVAWMVWVATVNVWAAPGGSETNFCVLLVVEGTVESAPANSTNWVAARTNQVIRIGEQVRTGLRSRAAIRLANRCILRLDELTTVVPMPSAEDAVLLKRGTQYFFNRDKPGLFRYRTALTSGTIRGTEFVLSVAESGRTVLSLLDGEVEAQAEGRSYQVKSGEQLVVNPDEPPVKTPLLQAVRVIQWCLYYPGILDLSDLPEPLSEGWGESAKAYRQGDLKQALAGLDPDLKPGSVSEKIYLAALLLSMGRVEISEALLSDFSAETSDESPDAKARRLAHALRWVVASIQNQPVSRQIRPQSATEWLAVTYYEQAEGELEQALEAAREAVTRSPGFGFGWARLAELEFGFGRLEQTDQALKKAFELSPKNAQAMALQGFIWAARNQTDRARERFEEAMVCDSALANAWLGRGLCLIRQGKVEEGRADLQVAATLEPQRALLRSYLGKAFSQSRDLIHARQELDRARQLDPRDPTAWLYSALLGQLDHRLNEGIRDLEHSRELNDNRSLFRSRLLLDQDRAMRSANLAALYRDAGLSDVSVREAARAVNSDPANSSAHLFLANSYDAWRDPRQVNLRYETLWFNELLLAHLLAPVGAGTLSQFVSQQEYSRLFEQNRIGLSSSTEYRSNGDWRQTASQYGTLDHLSYAVDLDYRQENGQRYNDDLESTTLYAKIKAQLTPQDSLLVFANTYDYAAGDVRQYYDPTDASHTLRIEEEQEPNLFLGYHRVWSPESHTLFLAGRLDDTLTLREPVTSSLVLTHSPPGQVVSAAVLPNTFFPADFSQDYERRLEAYSFELQQIWTGGRHNLIGGGRFQFGWLNTEAALRRYPGAPPPIFQVPPAYDEIESDLNRGSVYLYDFWRVVDDFQIHAGLSYDHLDYPIGNETLPITDEQKTSDQWSPKLGGIWTIRTNAHVYGAWTRSLGGMYYDTSMRLEPAQMGGFPQVYRSLIPESAPGAVAGLVPGAEFETLGVGIDHRLGAGTYLGLEVEQLSQAADRWVGTFAYGVGGMAGASNTRQKLDYEEKNLRVSIHQLLGRDWSCGARYGFSRADLETAFPEIPEAVQAHSGIIFDDRNRADLHRLDLYLDFHHACGFFSRLESSWYSQSNHGYESAMPGDDFLQVHLFAGYRFPRRVAEIQVGILNLTDTDYHLNPLNLHPYLQRDRTFTCRLQFRF
ncbi:MAG TPA: FecR domain-containing protein [Candidatus Paceibacterota bacterium]|nr:FecR domain-containing protein [Candidatus Paceibacterota bacterium]